MGFLKEASKPIRNSRGLMSTEFIFALTLSVGLCIVLFSLNFTLSMAEVAQYIAFSAARAHAAGHIKIENQEEAARIKFNTLINHPVLKPLFNNPDGGWFVLNELEVRSGGTTGSDFNDSYPNAEERPQVGVRFNFTPKVLNLKIAFLGSTSEDADGNAFSAKLTGLLIREPTFDECWNLQVKNRYDAIIELDPRYKVLGNNRKNQYVPMEDNGC